VTTDSEIEELAHSFNSMVSELKRYREQIGEHSRILEERVRERTEELRQKDAHLLQAEKLASIGLLASGVAHELNNPLTSILMNVNLVMEEIDPKSDICHDLQKIDQDATRCKQIIDDLRNFSKHHDLQFNFCSMHDLLGHTLTLVQHEFDLRGISVVKQFSSSLPSIYCDCDHLDQVFMNVFINAAQAMPSGGIVTVKTAEKVDGIEISIRDTGSGIPEEIRQRVFDPFFTTKENGTGLGLSISYRIIQEHGGRIEIASVTEDEREAGERGLTTGTTVTIFLPASKTISQ